MGDGLTTGLKVSTVVHVIVLAALLLAPLLVTGIRKARPPIPIEFTVAVPRGPAEPWVKPGPSPQALSRSEADHEEIGIPVNRDVGPSKPKPKAKPTKADSSVQRSRTLVTRYESTRSGVPEGRSAAQGGSGGITHPDGSPAGTPLSQSEIRRLLALGARPGAQTVIPGAEAVSFETIRKAIQDAWIQPRASDAGNAVVEVEINLGDAGTVTSWRIVRRSGVPAMDASVAAALKRVKTIDGLSTGFIQKHPSVTMAFRVEQ